MNLKFPEASNLVGSAGFEEVFLDELQQQEGELELHRFCNEGGWPDDDTLDLSIESITQQRGRTVVRVSCTFDEVMSTGCSDVQRSESAFGKFTVLLDSSRAEADVDYEVD